MEIIFYQNYAEKHRVDKTSFLVEKYRFNGTLREECSTRSPLILIQTENAKKIEAYVVDNDGDIVLGEGKKLLAETFFSFPEDVNYAYIPEFKRYYFITDIKTQNTNLFRFSFTCDVLMTFKEDIKNIDGVVNRVEFSPDDTSLPQLDNTLIDDRIVKTQKWFMDVMPVENNIISIPHTSTEGYWQYALTYRSFE